MRSASRDDLRAWFNDNADKTRLISIMSPTCGFCLIGHRTTRTLLEWLDGADLAAHRVWIPMMPPDTEKHAEAEAATFSDARLTDSYDGDHEVGRLYRDVLGLKATAWDTYLVYAPGVRWDDELPPKPTEHQYQLWAPWAPDQTRLLTPEKLWWTLVELVGWSQDDFFGPAEAIVQWVNDDTKARVGAEIPAAYQGA